jgi:GT2 family glycosyltransferase
MNPPTSAPASPPSRALDVFIITYFPKPGELERLLDSLVTSVGHSFATRVVLFDNSAEPSVTAHVRAVAQAFSVKLGEIALTVSPRNVGFGCGVNALLVTATADFILTINQDAHLARDALAVIDQRIATSGDDVAAWELRQVPYEHPKDYNPITQETMWLSGAACMFRLQALVELGGFEPRIFMYGEDVDLSWRLRRKNWRILYLPRAVCAHSSYAYVNEIKPVQFAGSVVANLFLRARFGSWRDILTGLAMLVHEMGVREEFPGRKAMLRSALIKFFMQLPAFRAGGWRENASVALPHFNRWDYGSRREGDFYAFPPPETLEPAPLVSILIRTYRRPMWLREALSTVMHQTYSNIEVVVVEDGAPSQAQAICAEAHWRFPVRYFATGERVGRSRAGNIAMQRAAGQWLNFLDDDDMLFADHVEVLVRAALSNQSSVVYSFAWEVPTKLQSLEPLQYQESLPLARYRERFSTIALWHHDFMPIQSVMFKQSVFADVGGFAEDMDQLEDWNLWTRFAAKYDFVTVEKTTSKYRVPADAATANKRQDALDQAYADAVARQAHIKIEATPETLMRWLKAHEAHLAQARHLELVEANQNMWRRRWFVRWPYALVSKFLGLRTAQKS